MGFTLLLHLSLENIGHLQARETLAPFLAYLKVLMAQHSMLDRLTVISMRSRIDWIIMDI